MDALESRRRQQKPPNIPSGRTITTTCDAPAECKLCIEGADRLLLRHRLLPTRQDQPLGYIDGASKPAQDFSN